LVLFSVRTRPVKNSKQFYKGNNISVFVIPYFAINNNNNNSEAKINVSNVPAFG